MKSFNPFRPVSEPWESKSSHVSVIGFVLLTLIMSSCAFGNGYQTKMQGWIGHDTNELVQVWGYPTTSFVAPNGNTVYLYQTSAQGHVPAYTTSDQFATGNFTFGGQTTQWYCSTWFEVDSNKIILQSRWEGNACR